MIIIRTKWDEEAKKAVNRAEEIHEHIEAVVAALDEEADGAGRSETAGDLVKADRDDVERWEKKHGEGNEDEEEVGEEMVELWQSVESGSRSLKESQEEGESDRAPLLK